MARVTQNVWGIVIILDHQETEDVLAVSVEVAEVANKLSSLFDEGDLAIVGFALQAVAVGISANVILIQQVDQGNGVFLTSPWVALGTIIPTTRPANVGIDSDWATRGSGEFHTYDSADLLAYEVQQSAVNNDAVEFSLEASDPNMWRKVLVLRDGLGSQWDIAIDPSQGTTSATNGLWADQVQNDQALSLWKAKQFGIMTWVLDVGGLGPLPPGSRVIFRWLQD
jgi:hypothetical protein